MSATRERAALIDAAHGGEPNSARSCAQRREASAALSRVDPTADASRRHTLSILCGCVVAACSILRERHLDRRADWLSIAARTVTLARLEGVAMPMYSLGDLQQFPDLARYCEAQASGLPTFASGEWRLADEIAQSAHNARRRTRATPAQERAA